MHSRSKTDWMIPFSAKILELTPPLIDRHLSFCTFSENRALQDRTGRRRRSHLRRGKDGDSGSDQGIGSSTKLADLIGPSVTSISSRRRLPGAGNGLRVNNRTTASTFRDLYHRLIMVQDIFAYTILKS